MSPNTASRVLTRRRGARRMMKGVTETKGSKKQSKSSRWKWKKRQKRDHHVFQGTESQFRAKGLAPENGTKDAERLRKELLPCQDILKKQGHQLKQRVTVSQRSTRTKKAISSDLGGPEGKSSSNREAAREPKSFFGNISRKKICDAGPHKLPKKKMTGQAEKKRFKKVNGRGKRTNQFHQKRKKTVTGCWTILQPVGGR